jgi:hypothetical protein
MQVSSRSALIALSLSLSCVVCLSAAHAQDCSAYTFECLHPEFLKSQIKQAYADYESPTTPVIYDAARGDYLAQFASPSGKSTRDARGLRCSSNPAG